MSAQLCGSGTPNTRLVNSAELAELRTVKPPMAASAPERAIVMATVGVRVALAAVGDVRVGELAAGERAEDGARRAQHVERIVGVDRAQVEADELVGGRALEGRTRVTRHEEVRRRARIRRLRAVRVAARLHAGRPAGGRQRETAGAGIVEVDEGAGGAGQRSVGPGRRRLLGRERQRLRGNSDAGRERSAQHKFL